MPINTRARSKNQEKSDEAGPTESPLVRLSVNLNAETAAALRELADDRDISFTEAVRRAISVYKFMNDETQSGRHIQTTDADRTEVRELILM